MYTNNLKSQVRDYDETFNGVEVLLKEFFPNYYEEWKTRVSTSKELEKSNS